MLRTNSFHSYFLIFSPNFNIEGNLENLSPKHEQLLSAVLVAKMDRRDSSEVGDDDVPPPLPTTSPPKLSPDSTLTWNQKDRVPLNLGMEISCCEYNTIFIQIEK